MSQMADGAGTGGEVYLGSKSDNTGPMTSTGIDAALKAVPAPKQNDPPKILPNLIVPYGDTLATEKGCELELQSDIHLQLNVEANVRPSEALLNINPEMESVEQKKAANTRVMLGIANAAASAAATLLGYLAMWTSMIGTGAVAGVAAFIATLLRLLNCVRGRLAGMGRLIVGEGAVAAEKVTTEALKNINPEMVRRRIAYLLNVRGFHHHPRRKDFTSEYSRKVEVFIAKHEVSSLDEILSKEMDHVFLQQLLDHILDILDAENMIMSPLTNSTPTGDPILEFLAAAPSSYLRANAELPAPILDD